jgi:2-keto-3-deoxygluconate permease
MKPVIKIFKKIPGAIVIIPMFVGMLLLLIIDASLSESAYLAYKNVVIYISNALMILLVFWICSQLDFRKVSKSLSRGVVLLSLKFIIGATLAIITIRLFGSAGIFGISALAIVAAITNPNTALFAGIATQYGEEEDAPSIMVLCFGHGPFFTLLVLAASGLVNVDIFTMLIPLLPMILGVVVGNLFPKLQPYLLKMAGATLPIFALLLGTTISLTTALQGGVQGLLLGLVTLILTGVLAFFVSRIYMGKNKFSPVAIGTGTTAGNAIIVPIFIAGLNDIPYEIVSVSGQATAQIAGSMIFTAIFAPILVAVFFRYEQKRREKLGIEMIKTYTEQKGSLF